MVNAWSGSMNAASLSPTPTDLTITPRDRRFGREAATPRLWNGGRVEATALYNALSATFPVGEAFFVESVRAFRDGADPKLAEDIKNFTTPTGKVADSALYSAVASTLPPCHSRGVAASRPKRRSRGVIVRSVGVGEMLAAFIEPLHALTMRNGPC